MHARQRGVTFIGWLLLLIPVALVSYSGIRAAPIYLNYMKVSKTLDQTASEIKGTDPSVNVASIRNTLRRRFDIEEVDFPAVDDIVIRRDGANWVIEAKYEDTAPLFANLALLLSFDKTSQSTT